MRMTRSKVMAWVLLALLMLLMCTCSRDGIQQLPASTGGRAQGTQIPQGFGDGWTPDCDWLPVLMQPERPVDAPDKSLSSLFAPVAQLELPMPDKVTSYDPADLTKNGADFEDGLQTAKVSVFNSRAILRPDWPLDTGGEPAGIAAAVYRFPLADYDLQTTVGFEWLTEPAEWPAFYVGFANPALDRWEWYHGPADGVLTVGSFADYFHPNGDLLFAVVMLGTAQCELLAIEIGADETRFLGMQDISEDPPDDIAPLMPLSPVENCPLPESFDLRPFTAPIGDQQNWGSCTAFAIAQGAYNIILTRLYSGYGWDHDQPRFQAGPKYHYFKSGESQALGIGVGRKMPQTIQDMIDAGTASEANAPYDMKNEANWDSTADADAAVLRPDGYGYVYTEPMGGVASIKAVLALQQLPLIADVSADWDWAVYEPGTVIDTTPGGENHAVCIVGYDNAKGADGAFLVRNSWGEYWGEGGYCWVSYASFEGSKHVWSMWDNFDPAVVEHFPGHPVGEVPGAPSIPPPVNIAASDGTYADHVTVTWDAVNGATGYRIYRDQQSNLVEEVGAVTAWDDFTLTTLCAHPYWVTALSGSEESLRVSLDTGYLDRPPVPIEPGEWPMVGRDLRHQRRTLNVGPATAEQKWRLNIGGSINKVDMYVEPIMDNTGKLYCSNGEIWACFSVSPSNPAQGKIWWRFYRNDNVINGYGGAIGNGCVYFGDGDGRLTALDYTGRADWVYTAAAAIKSPPVVTADGTIYASTIGGDLLALNSDGSEKWVYNAGGEIYGSLSIGLDGALYFGCGTKLVKGADGGDHFDPAWEYPSDGIVECTPTIGDSVVYFTAGGSGTDKAYALDFDGNLVSGWPYAGSSYADRPLYKLSSALAADGTLYVPGIYRLMALSPAGVKLWDFAYPDSQYVGGGSPIVDGNGTIYITSWHQGFQNEARVFALNPDGSEKWRIQPVMDISARSVSPVIGSDGLLYVVSTWADVIAIGEVD